MVLNLFDNWYVDWNITTQEDWKESELTYTLFMDENDGRGRKNFILKDEISPDDKELIENRIKGEFNL